MAGRIPIVPPSDAEAAIIRTMRAYTVASEVRREAESIPGGPPLGPHAVLARAAADLCASDGYRPERRVVISVPIETRNESNVRGHPLGKKYSRAKLQSSVVPQVVGAAFAGRQATLGPVPTRQVVLVTITRASSGELDDDGLERSMKHVRDAVAGRLGLDDADPRIRFVYLQRDARKIGMDIQLEWGFRGA